MLRTLLNFWLMPFFGMMFAAGATISDVGTGGGDAGSGSSGGDGGDGTSGTSVGNESGESVPSGDGTSDDGSGEGEGGQDGQRDGGDPNALVDSGDGRKIPQKYQELFKTDKALREMYFSQSALKKAFPGGVKEAVALAKSVEEFGGVEAVEQLQSELATHQADGELFEKADPKWVESGFQENPEASLKLFAHSLEYVSQNHPEHYDHLIAKAEIADINANLPVSEMYDVLAALKDNPKAAELAKKLAAFYNHRDKLARKVPEKQIDPQQKKLDARDAELTKKSQEIRNKSINSEAAPHMQRQIDAVLGSAAKAAGLDLAKLQKDQPNRWGRFLKDARTAIHQNVLSDTKWLDRYSAALATGDTAKCVRMLNARHDQAINGVGETPGVVAPIFHEWFGAPKAGTRQNAGGNNATRQTQGGNRAGNAGGTGKETPVFVNSLPPAKDINYNAPETDKWAGIYRLKSGKLIQVKRP